MKTNKNIDELSKKAKDFIEELVRTMMKMKKAEAIYVTFNNPKKGFTIRRDK